MKQLILFLCAAISVLAVITQAYAQMPANEYPAAFIANINSNYVNVNDMDKYLDGNTPGNKFGEGGMNMATAWVEVPQQMAEVTGESNAVIGATFGLGKGLVYGLARGIAGVVDMVTFGLPPYDEPLMKPQYKAENPDQGLKVSILNW